VVVVFPSPLRPLPSTLSPYTTLFRSSAGAIDDATAWCVLAVVLASFGASASIAVTAIVGGIVFAAFMIFVMRRLLIPLGRRAEHDRAIGKPLSPVLLATVLMLFMFTAYVADAIGLHAVFGGFLLGTIMPRGALTEQLRKQLEPVTVVLLLPMFFTFSGLNTQLTLVSNLELLGV